MADDRWRRMESRARCLGLTYPWITRLPQNDLLWKSRCTVALAPDEAGDTDTLQSTRVQGQCPFRKIQLAGVFFLGAAEGAEAIMEGAEVLIELAQIMFVLFDL